MYLLWFIGFVALGSITGLLVWIWTAKPRAQTPPQQFPQGYSENAQSAEEATQRSTEEQQKQTTTAVAAWWWLQNNKSSKDTPSDEPKA